MAHYLRGNAANRVPSHHVCVDTETIPVPQGENQSEHHHQLMLGVASSWRYRGEQSVKPVEYTFRQRSEWWDWLRRRCQRKCRVWIWAHNAPFDFTVLGLWDELDAGRLRLKRPPVREVEDADGSIRLESAAPSLITSPFCFLADCEDDEGRSYRFVDSANFAPLSLQELGTLIGSEKLTMPGECADESDWLEYCAQDARILHQVVDRVCRFVKGHDLGNMQFTLGGQAMSHYRHKHLDAKIVIGPDDAIRPLERDGYYGARAQVYFRGEAVEKSLEAFRSSQPRSNPPPVVFVEGVYRVDVNQCYPYVMSGNRYPVRLFRHLASPSINELKDMLVHHVAVAAVKLFSPVEPYPQRRNGKTTWRVGRVHTVLCGPELERAVKSGHVSSVDECQVYFAEPIFDSWFREITQWRWDALEKGDAFLSLLLKRMANSLHGKFGQSGRVWETVVDETPPQRWGQYAELDADARTVRECRAVAGVKQVLSCEADGRGCCPAIAAWVCSYAREHMRTARMIAGDRHVFYEDADSLHVDDQGYKAMADMGLLHATRPGAFKLEAEAGSAEYFGQKHYRFGTETLVPGHAKNGAYDARGIWHQDEWVRLDSLLARGKPQAPITIARELSQPHSHSDEMYHRDGWIVFRQGE